MFSDSLGRRQAARHYYRLERASIHLLLLYEIEKGLADVEAGRTSRVEGRSGRSLTIASDENEALAEIRYTANFAANLESIKAFWDENKFPQGYDRLLDELTDVVLSNLERQPCMGTTVHDSTAGVGRSANGG